MGKGNNQVLAAVRRWPRWAKWTAGIVTVLVILGLIGAASEEPKEQPVSVVGDIQTTLTLPPVTTAGPTTAAPTTQPATTQAPITVTAPATTRAPVTTAATTPATAPAPTRPSSVYYANCTAARAAGAAPIYRGEPGYGSHLDRDNDGVACET